MQPIGRDTNSMSGRGWRPPNLKIEMNTNTTADYLGFSLLINLIRIVMYILYPVHVASVKITIESWKNKGIQEVMYAYTQVILIFS
jgi:sulfite exporter TauE/SafE